MESEGPLRSRAWFSALGQDFLSDGSREVGRCAQLGGGVSRPCGAERPVGLGLHPGLYSPKGRGAAVSTTAPFQQAAEPDNII